MYPFLSKTVNTDVMTWSYIIRAVITGFVVSGFVVGCSTRSPEDPTSARGTFAPPTSPGIVVDNFRNAVSEKNTENFMLCLADRTSRSSYDYRFEPSAEVRARFASLFDSWTLQSERQNFLSFIARLAPEQRPILELTNTNIAFSSPDSVVFVSDYALTSAIAIAGVPGTLTGTLIFTITPEPSGLWSISRWSDSRRAADTVETTWSVLKAAL